MGKTRPRYSEEYSRGGEPGRLLTWPSSLTPPESFGHSPSRSRAHTVDRALLVRNKRSFLRSSVRSVKSARSASGARLFLLDDRFEGSPRISSARAARDIHLLFHEVPAALFRAHREPLDFRGKQNGQFVVPSPDGWAYVNFAAASPGDSERSRFLRECLSYAHVYCIK